MTAPDPMILARLAGLYAIAQQDEAAAHAAALAAEEAVRVTDTAFREATVKTRGARHELLNYALNGSTADFIAEAGQ